MFPLILKVTASFGRLLWFVCTSDLFSSTWFWLLEATSRWKDSHPTEARRPDVDSFSHWLDSEARSPWGLVCLARTFRPSFAPRPWRQRRRRHSKSISRILPLVQEQQIIFTFQSIGIFLGMKNFKLFLMWNVFCNTLEINLKWISKDWRIYFIFLFVRFWISFLNEFQFYDSLRDGITNE